MKIACDLCNGELEMKAGGQGAICTTCGLAYSLARLKEKLGAQPPAAPVEEAVIYDVVDFEVIEKPGNATQTPHEVVHAVLVQAYGTTSVFPDALIGMDEANKADFLVCAKGYASVVFFIVGNTEAGAYQRAVQAGKIWESRGFRWYTIFEKDCHDPAYVDKWIREAMEKIACS